MATAAEQLDGFGANALLDGLFDSATAVFRDFVTVDVSTVLLGLIILSLIFTASSLLYGLIESAAYSNSIQKLRSLHILSTKANSRDPAVGAIYSAAYREELAYFNKMHGSNFRDREREKFGHLYSDYNAPSSDLDSKLFGSDSSSEDSASPGSSEDIVLERNDSGVYESTSKKHDKADFSAKDWGDIPDDLRPRGSIYEKITPEQWSDTFSRKDKS